MISFSRLSAMTWARSLEFLRDFSALGWNVAFPVLMVGGFAMIFSGPGQPLFKVAVVTEAPLTGATHPFLATEHVQFYRETDLDAALSKVSRHQVDMVLDLREPPAGVSQKAEGSSALAPGAAGRYWANPESPKGETLEQVLKASAGAALVRQEVQGARIRYVDWVVPGLLGMNMMFSCLFGIGYVIVRYRKSGYLKRLKATPLTAFEFLMAQLLSRLALIMLITGACFVGTNLFLNFRMEGSYLDLFVVTLLGAVCMVAMGLVVSARTTSEEFAGGILNMVSWPMMILSGVFFSLDGAPQAVQIGADLFPLTHLLVAARAVMLDGAALTDLAYPMGMLGAMTVVFMAVGAGLFRWIQD